MAHYGMRDKRFGTETGRKMHRDFSCFVLKFLPTTSEELSCAQVVSVSRIHITGIAHLSFPSVSRPKLPTVLTKSNATISADIPTKQNGHPSDQHISTKLSRHGVHSTQDG